MLRDTPWSQSRRAPSAAAARRPTVTVAAAPIVQSAVDQEVAEFGEINLALHARCQRKLNQDPIGRSNRTPSWWLLSGSGRVWRACAVRRCRSQVATPDKLNCQSCNSLSSRRFGPRRPIHAPKIYSRGVATRCGTHATHGGPITLAGDTPEGSHATFLSDHFPLRPPQMRS